MAYPAAAVTASGVNWAGFQKNGFAGLLEALIAANLAPSLDPSAAPTLSATADAGSTLPTATYFVKITETNAWGETRPSSLSSGQAITSGTNHLTVTFPSLRAGNTARNVYVGTASDGSNLKLTATGVTASTAAVAAPLPVNSYAVSPPAVNSTGLTFVDASGATINKSIELLRHVEKDNARALFRYLSTILRDFLRGDPVPFNAAAMKLNHARGALAMLLQLCNEAGTLVDANPGTIAGGPIVGNLYPNPRRQWP